MLYIFFFNDTATTEIYTYCHTLSLHDALPISGFAVVGTYRAAELGRRPVLLRRQRRHQQPAAFLQRRGELRFELFDEDACRIGVRTGRPDRKSTRLNSSH